MLTTPTIYPEDELCSIAQVAQAVGVVPLTARVWALRGRMVENHAYSVDVLFMHYNFCWPHTTLTKADPQHYPTTPAMAAGIASHIWTLEEVCGLLDPSRVIEVA